MKLPNAISKHVAAEFKGSQVGDKRLNHRAQQTARLLSRAPGKPIPEAMKTTKALEGCYRMVNNDRVTMDGLLEGPMAAMSERAAACGSVLVVHDSSECQFAHASAEDIGYLGSGKAGFLAHVSLVLDAQQWRRPLGVSYVETLHREQRSGRGSRRKKASGAETATWKDRESLRWLRGVEQSEARLSACPDVLHVADRESDFYGFMATVVASRQGKGRFVLRVNHDRKARRPTDETWCKVKALARESAVMVERDVPLSRRVAKTAPRANKTHKPRTARRAQLCIGATTVQVCKPRYGEAQWPETLTVNVVYVSEPNPPQGQEPVEWILYTTEPVQTVKQVEHVVDVYRTRWTIEEYFKALKQGCLYEKRQFESRQALLAILALSLPIACNLLWMRSMARQRSDAPATEVLSALQLKVLAAISDGPLPSAPTARQALRAIAALGGHQRNNGEPGWLILARGYRTLLGAEQGWMAAIKEFSSDQ